MGEARAYAGPVVVIADSTAFLLSQLLRAPQVQAFVREAGWLHTSPDFVRLRKEVDAAAVTWSEQRLRSDALRCSLGPPAGAKLIAVEQASTLLGLGRRQIQALARCKRIESWKSGGRWQLSHASVAAYGEQQGRALCRTWNGSRDDITRNCHTATN